MPGLLDVAELKRTVVVNGTKVDVPGVSAFGIATLLERFPDFRKALTGKKFDVTPEWLFANVPDAVAAVIAAGSGFPGDDDAEAVAATLPLAAQVDLLEAILEVTLPNGVAPFVERLRKIAERFGVEVTSTAVTS